MARTPGETRGRPRKEPSELDAVSAKLAISLRERINAEADPVGFLCRVVRGEEIDGVTPDFGTRVEVATKLSAKLVPDLKGIEVSGGDKPVELGSGAAFDAIASKLGRIAESQRAASTTH